ncbi:motility associated factor glycosyltransferase family protein [Dethiothermospora halolimnae]|uniref:motility associated factor glycosyltransferase family protein n=1 Tax=Dethiothermospora halolimnae TaxID=3114390 RepID=UPI003CCBC63B
MDFYKVELEKAKNGENTFKVKYDNREIYIHSKYNPTKEAKKGLKALSLEDSDKNTVFICMGLGLGYNLIELYKSITLKNKIIVIEPNKEIIKYNYKVNDVLKKGNVKIIKGIDLIKVKETIENNIKLENYNNIKIYELTPYKKIYKDYLKKVYDVIYKHENQLKLHINTNRLHGQKISENAIKNLPYIIRDGKSIDILKNKFYNKPAIIVSAGPSLEKNIDLLKDIQNDAFIISGGRTLKPLLEKGIIPHLICSIDPQDIAFKLIDKLDFSEIPLVTLIHGNYKVVSNHKGQVLFIGDKYHNPMVEYITKKTLEEIEVGGSVATTSLSVAKYIGCNPICFIGQDLAYTDNKYYSDNASINKDNNISKNEELLKVKNIYGNDIFTNESLYYFLKLIEEFISTNKSNTYINATEGGAKISGTKDMTLKDFIEKYCHEAFYPKDKLRTCLKEDINGIKEVNIAKQNIKDVIENLNNLEKFSLYNMNLADKLSKVYLESSQEDMENILSKMDINDNLIEKYKNEELMMHYFRQLFLIDIVNKYEEKTYENPIDRDLRIINKDKEIYKMKSYLANQYKSYFNEILTKL